MPRAQATMKKGKTKGQAKRRTKGEPKGGAPVSRPSAGAPLDRVTKGEPKGGAPVGRPSAGAPLDRVTKEGGEAMQRRYGRGDAFEAGGTGEPTRASARGLQAQGGEEGRLARERRAAPTRFTSTRAALGFKDDE